MSVLGKVWKIKNTDPSASVLKKLLSNRGLAEESEIERFFNPDPARDFHDPFLMSDMERAVRRIGEAIEKSERIIIFGDYDVDGITGTAILMRALRTLKANVSCRLPHRIEDGYGLREKFIHEFKKLDVKILITVDNGISCSREAALAKELGIDLIITDHHTIPEKIPDAYAILHPKLPQCGYPFTELTGAGVALKLAQALFIRRTDNAEEYTKNLLDLACMGTIADLGELRGENRYIVKEGLRVMENTRWPGLSRLKEYAGVQGKIDTHDIGFLLSPRINAAGRISHPSHALKLLIHDAEGSHIFAEELERLNRKRQGMMEELMKLAETFAEEQANDPLIVVFHPTFHGGVIGLIAARLSEKYSRPAIALEDRGEVCVGSCRSVPSFNVVSALTTVKPLLTNFGGHAAAAGFELRKENLPAFIKEIKAHARGLLSADLPEPTLEIDCELSHADISEKTVQMVQWLEPFGVGNQAPRFLCKNLPLTTYSTVGSEKKHLKIVSRLNGASFDCIGFKLGQFEKLLNGTREIDAVGELEENIWRGRRTLQLKMVDFKPVG